MGASRRSSTSLRWWLADPAHERLRLDEDGAVEAIEAAHELHRLLDHGQLIRSHRHQVGLEGGDVGGLADRVDEESGGDLRAEALLPDFFLDGGIALEPGHGDEVQEIAGELGELGYSRLDHDGGHSGVDARGEVVEGDLAD